MSIVLTDPFLTDPFYPFIVLTDPFSFREDATA